MLWEAQFGDFANGAQVRVRPVHLVGRAQVAAHVRPRLPAAARLRGPGAGAFLGAARALPAAVRRGQHAGRQLHHAGQLLPHPAPAAEARVPQAADPDDAEVAAAPQARGVDARRDGRRDHRSTACCGTTPSCCTDETIKLVKDDKIRRVVLCSGKVYYDLYEEREKRGIDDVYLLRVEQLYPFPAKALIARARRASRTPRWSGARKSRKNMGAWTFVEPYLEWVLDAGRRQGRSAPRYVGRPASAATATGLMSKHLRAAAGVPRRGACGLSDASSIRHSATRGRARSEKRHMATEIRVPTLGESVTEATVGKWFKKPGDAVEGRRAAASSWRPTRSRSRYRAGRRRARPRSSPRTARRSRVGALLGSIDGRRRRPPRRRRAAEGRSAAGAPAPAAAAPAAAAAAPTAAAGRMPPRPSVAQARRRERRRCRRRRRLRQGRPRDQGRRARRASRRPRRAAAGAAPAAAVAAARARRPPTTPRAKSA